MGLFSTIDRVEQHYVGMERRFLDLATAMEVPAANLDSLIWHKMRTSPRLVAGLFGQSDNADQALKLRTQLPIEARPVATGLNGKSITKRSTRRLLCFPGF